MDVIAELRRHAHWCRRLGSPLYAYLLSECAAHYEPLGPVRDLLLPHEADDPRSGLPLRLMAAAHRLVLTGQAPELARYYPSAGGTAELEPAWSAFRNLLAARAAEVERLLERPVQTNDPARSGSLLGGFLLVANLTGFPLRLLEVGASAGLNLCWDRYRYEWDGGGWGDPQSAVRVPNLFVSGAPVHAPTAKVASRAGCDPQPVDIQHPDGRLTLLACTWPDHTDRLRRLQAAIEIARAESYRIEPCGAADWLERQLAEPAPGTATVVYHSVVWPYMCEAGQQRMAALIEKAANRATPQAPLAWLRMEPGGEEAEVRLRIAPGYEERVIAACGFHTPSVRWLAEPLY